MTQPQLEPLNANDAYVVGVDLGGTKILAAVVDADGQIISESKAATKANQGADQVIERIARCVRDALERAGLETSQIQAIGVGSPGPLDPDTGVIIYTPNLKWKNVPLKAKLEEHLGIPTFVDNDVNVGTLGESVFGAGKGVKNLVGIFVGTGIGGGVILDGKLFHGVSKNAGEVGHIIVKANGPRCGCGNRGCLEGVASRTAIARDIRKAIKKGKKSILPKLNGGNLDMIRSRALAKAVERGDKLAVKIMKRAEKYLGLGVVSIVHLLNPEMVVLGGGVVEAMGDEMVARVRDIAAKYALPNTMNGVQIVPAKLGDHAGVIGAAVLARQRLELSII
jgi:glucokinase